MDSEKFSIELRSLSTSINLKLFNSTRKFFRQAGIEYDVDMKRHWIIVNHDRPFRFLMKFDTYNYVRIAYIPANGFEVLVQCNSPMTIVRKLFDYKFITLGHVNEIYSAFQKAERDKIEEGLKKAAENAGGAPASGA